MSGIEVEPIKDCVRIRLANGVQNLLTTDVIGALSAALSAAARDARGVLLCGGDKFFSNGVDLDWALARSAAEMREMFMALGDCILRVMECPVPVVGAVRGHAIGGAFALFIACDYRFGARGRVLLGKPEILLGVPNPYYGDQLLRFVAGDFVASDLIYSGRLVTAEAACDLNIVHGVDEPDGIEAVAWERLRTLCELAPDAFAESKSMRNADFIADVRAQLSARVVRQVEIWNGGEAQARLRAAADRLKR